MALSKKQKLWMTVVVLTLVSLGIVWPPAWILLFAVENLYSGWVFILHNAIAEAIGEHFRIEPLPLHKRVGQYLCPAVGVITFQCFSTLVLPPSLATLSVAFISMFVAWAVRETDAFTPRVLAGFAAFFVIFTIGSFAALYCQNGIITPDSNADHELSHALYFSVVTWTTLGYGDYQPTERLQMVAATEALCGYVTMAMFLGALLVVRDKEKKDDAKKFTFAEVSEWFQTITMGQDCEVQVKRSEDTVELITKRSNGSIQSVEIDLKNRKVNIRDADPGENKRKAT